MAQKLDRRPGDKAGPELPQERLARAKIEANLDQRSKDAQKALEKAQGGGEVDAEVAAQLQKSLGNAAVAGMMKGKGDTDTSTTDAEATLDQAREEGEEEELDEDKDKDAGELEQVLPSFSTGGGGGGGGAGGGGTPWAQHMFGGDGDDDEEMFGPARPRWRPMPVPPDPDEEVEAERVDDEEAAVEADELSFGEADSRLGVLPWTAGALSRGLRHPARMVGRAVMDDEGATDAVWSRARAALGFLAEHANEATARAVAAGAVSIGVAPSTPLVLALAGELALLEATLERLDPGWHALVDTAADQRARIRAEAAAAALPAAELSALSLLSTALGEAAPPSTAALPETAHPAAVAALHAAARSEAFPRVEPWRTSLPSAAGPDEDAALAALDAVLDAHTEPQAPLPPLGAFFAQIDATLTALGALQVEAAAAALAAWPWLPDGLAEAALTELDDTLRKLARRLVAAGRAVDTAARGGDLAAVEASASEAAGTAAAAEFIRQVTFSAIGGPLLPPGGTVAPPADSTWSQRLAAGGAEALRVELRGESPLLAFARRARLDGAAAAGETLAGLEGEAALLHAAALASVGARWDAARRAAAWVGEGRPGPYGLAWAALLTAYAKQDPNVLEAAAPTIVATGEGGALALLKVAWVGLRRRAAGVE